MARYTGPVCRICRRHGLKLFLKGERCFGPKCAIERRNYPPGDHGQRRRKLSEYANQLKEKQKSRYIYGVLERQFRKHYATADRGQGATGAKLLRVLESRLDNVVYRMGFGASRKEARQLVRHGHVQVNGSKLDVPSAEVQPGDEVRIAPGSKDILPVAAALAARSRPTTVAWLAVDEGSRTGRMVSRPTRADIPLAVQEQLIVELYSK